MGLKSWMETMAPFVAMFSLECMIVGLNTMSKAAMTKGMNHFVFVFYANALAFLIILPICLVFDRNKRPPLNFSILCKFFFVTVLGSTINPNCNYAGIDYSSPTLGSAMRNLIPAFTFLLAVIFRMEKLNMRSWKSYVKIMATLLSISGALVLTFYKGPPICSSGDESLLKGSYHLLKNFINLMSSERNWVIGGLLLATTSFGISMWITAQGAIVKEYPSVMTIVTFYFLFGSIQCAAVALVAEGNHPNAWKLRPDVELLPVIYSAVFASLGTFFVEIWCVRKKGPVFVSMFKPPGVAIAALMNFIILGERLHVGTVVGSIIVIIGFYGVIWAKAKENEEEELSQEKSPLLQNDTDAVA